MEQIHTDWKTLSYILLISCLFAASQAKPDPDTHLHVHLPPEDGSPGGFVKFYGGLLCPFPKENFPRLEEEHFVLTIGSLC